MQEKNLTVTKKNQKALALGKINQKSNVFISLFARILFEKMTALCYLISKLTICALMENS